MAVLVASCPRCLSERMTFDLARGVRVGLRYDWQREYEAFCICRHCHQSTVFFLRQREIRDEALLDKTGLEGLQGSVDPYVSVEGFVSLKEMGAIKPPDFIPENVSSAFSEGAKCLAIRCYNAAGTMFRLCIDLATRSRLPVEEKDDLTRKVRRDLGLRLPWLFDNGLLPEDLRELSACVKEDGNDGAHAGTLTEEDAADLLDFTQVLLERMYTEPRRLSLARERRIQRRGERAG